MPFLAAIGRLAVHRFFGQEARRKAMRQRPPRALHHLPGQSLIMAMRKFFSGYGEPEAQRRNDRGGGGADRHHDRSAVVRRERLDRSVVQPARRPCRDDHGRRAVAFGRLRADGASVLLEPSQLRRAASARRAWVTSRSVRRRAP
jgi:hypothetical protein